LKFDLLHYGYHSDPDKYFLYLEYEVEEIVAMRLDPEVAKMGITTTDPTLYQYRLKWKGFQKLSWVPFEDLNCPQLLNEFLKSIS
jgi:hypothetical protein